MKPGEKPPAYPPQPPLQNPLAALSASERSRLPNLIVIGAAKAGTSALHAYLAEHPQISMSRRKELELFGGVHWKARLPWYAAQFEAGAAVRGETSPVYAMDPYVPGVPEQMAAVLPEPRFVYLVGDPVARAIAHWREQRMMTFERRTLVEAFADVGDPRNPYVAASRYGHQLGQYVAVFGRERVLVVDQEDLRRRRRETLRKVFAFVGVDDTFWDDAYEAEPNKTTDKLQVNRFGLWLLDHTGAAPWARRAVTVRGITASRGARAERAEPAVRAKLADVLRPDIDRFRTLAGMPFASWSV